MTAVDLPPPAVAGTGTTASQPAVLPLGEVGLQQLPDRLSLLTRPVVLTGTVTGQTADGGTRLRTQAGEVVIRTGTALPAETPVTLQIGAGQPPTRATAFVTLPAGPLGASGPVPASGAGTTAATLAALALPAGAEPAAVTTSLGPLARAAGSGAPLPQPAAGTVVPGQVLTLAGRGEPPPTPSPGNTPSGSAPVPLAPGSVVAVRLLGPPPGADAPAPEAPPAGSPARDSAPSQPQMITGTVTGTTATGRPILTTPLGALALTLPPDTALPPGTRLAVALGDPRDMVVAHPPPARPALPAPGMPTLGDALSALAELDAPLAHALLHSVVPQANHRLASALTFFMDQVRRGGARSWLGEEATRALVKAGRGDVLSRLDRDFRTMGRDAEETPAGEWRPFTIPFFDGGTIQRLDLFVRAVANNDEESGPGRDKSERSHRFVLDLDLSRFGALQLDGLVKPRRFDLILRSQAPLPDDLRATLHDVFSSSLGAVDFTGSLSFKAGSRGWVKPLARPGGGRGQAVVA